MTNDEDDVTVNPGGEVESNPSNMAVGGLPEGMTIDDARAELGRRGIAPDRLEFLSGQEGKDYLQHDAKGPLKSVKAAWDNMWDDFLHRDEAQRILDAGQVLVRVMDTPESDERAVRQALVDAGVIGVHYYGKWTFK